MKKLTLLAISLFLASFACGHVYVQGKRSVTSKEKREIEQDVRIIETAERILDDIEEEMTARGYVALEELKKIANISRQMPWQIKSARFSKGHSGTYGHTAGVFDIYATIVEEDYLPFKAMLYLALEKEDWDEAESIKASWTETLNEISSYFKNYFYPIDRKTNEKVSLRDFAFTQVWGSSMQAARGRMGQVCPYRAGDRDVLGLVQKVDDKISRLTSIVGLTDPMIVTLRKELTAAIKQRKWDEAQKIQNIITARVNELRPPQPQVIYKELPGAGGGKTTVVVPSEQHIKVEHIPRYGAEDVGRAISLLQGKGGRLTSKEAGALKMLDILMKR